MTTTRPNRITHIIVAAGSGSRFGGDIPKQFQLLAGVPVVMRCIDALRNACPGSECRLVISQTCAGLWDDLCRRYRFESPTIVYGGATRWESVRNAIASIPAPEEGDVITVHDGARPLVGRRLIQEAIEACRNHSGAIPVIPVTDSIRMIGPDGSSTVDRSSLRAVQTPQAFAATKLTEAYRLPYRETFTDDASVMTAAGYTDIALTQGDTANIKITHPLDLEIAELYLRRI